MSELELQITEVGNEIRQLKLDKAEPSIIKERVAVLNALKAQLPPAGGDDKSKPPGRMQLKTVKGTRDFDTKESAVRNILFDLITRVFENHGAGQINTPSLELRDILMGKYGEEGGKLIYDLKDEGGERASLRYDLTVPFARFLAQRKVNTIKKYQIANVYRRDQPYMTKGRYREFAQCDFDIAGAYVSMSCEAECVLIIDEVLSQLALGTYEIRTNHRGLLEGIFEVAGAPQSEFKVVCSSIDKLDKCSWADVREELISVKLVDAKVVDVLGEYVRVRELNPQMNKVQLLEWFERDERASKNKKIMDAVGEMKLMFEYGNAMGVSESAVFEPSLARGLDYYTGVIYEAIILEPSFKLAQVECSEEEQNARIGSVAAGGRYDKLVGDFIHAASGKKKASSKNDVPCIGISFGVERLFTLLEQKLAAEDKKVNSKKTQVFVSNAHASSQLLLERMKVIGTLWKAQICAEYAPKNKVQPLTQIRDCEEENIPLMVVIGDDELKNGTVQIRNVLTRENTVSFEDLFKLLILFLGNQKRRNG
uniref:Histidine--tRNA ligase n=1 Tax=Rhabditophanes sp. KR3021 TaxID=114890 RepID=A0AC35UAT9_9BILA